MYCDQCGNKLEDNQKFCPVCGAKIGEKQKKNSIKEIKSNEDIIDKENSYNDISNNVANHKFTNSKIKLEKISKTQHGLFIAIVVVAIVCVLSVVSFLLLHKKIHNAGTFKKVDGIDTYYENDSLVKNSLVEVNGKKYFVDEEGHKKKNTWEIIDNDNHYGYFGSLGELVKNTIKEIDNKYYYFDEEGILVENKLINYNNEQYYATDDGALLHNSFRIENGNDMYFAKNGKLRVKEGWVRNINDNDAENKSYSLPTGIYYINEKGQREKEKWIGDSYVDEDGKLVKNAWVGEYYVGNDGKYMTNCVTPDGKKIGEDGKVIGTVQVETTVNKTISQVNNIVPKVVVAESGNSSQLPISNATNQVQNSNQLPQATQIAQQIQNNYTPNTNNISPTNSKKSVSPSSNLSKEEIEDYYSGPGAVSSNTSTSTFNGSYNNSNINGPSGVIYSSGPTSTYKVVKGYVEGENDEDDEEWDDGYSDDDEYDEYDEELNSEIKILRKEKITDTYEDEDYECNITILLPVVSGGNSSEDEPDVINSCIEEKIDELSEQIETIINDYSPIPKSIIFNSATITTSTSRKLTISLSGNITLRSGSRKVIKFKISYDRENQDADLTRS